jgi:hypothetical protein
VLQAALVTKSINISVTKISLRMINLQSATLLKTDRALFVPDRSQKTADGVRWSKQKEKKNR